jgi:hypothetical protein
MRRGRIAFLRAGAFGAAVAMLAATSLSVAAQVDGGPARGFTVVNAGPHRIHAVYVSPSTSPGWGDNLLGQGLAASEARALQAQGLKPGRQTAIRVAADCGVFDVRFVAENGTEFVEEEVELCGDDDVVTIGKADLRRARRDGSRPEGR